MSSPVKAVERYGVLLNLKAVGKWLANRLLRSSKKAKHLN
jgi:hypothetical protein